MMVNSLISLDFQLLAQNPNNAFTIYAKGLAFYHEHKWQTSIDYFRRAREFDGGPDMERAEIMQQKALAKFNNGTKSTPTTAVNIKPSSPSSAIRRFGCELCGHFFGKKFNLDRHNRSIHKRDTPEDFPSPTSKHNEQQMKIEPTLDIYMTEEVPEEGTIESPLKKRNPLSAFGIKSRVKCPVCKKFCKKPFDFSSLFFLYCKFFQSKRAA